MNAYWGIAGLIDFVIAFTLIECAVLALYSRATRKGVAPRDFLMNMASGLFLMLALRCLAHETGAPWIAACLLAAGVTHGTDLAMRWRGSRRAASPVRAGAA